MQFKAYTNNMSGRGMGGHGLGYAARLEAERNYSSNMRFLKKVVQPARIVTGAPTKLDADMLNDFVRTLHNGYKNGYSERWDTSKRQLRDALVRMLDCVYGFQCTSNSVKAQIAWKKLSADSFPAHVKST